MKRHEKSDLPPLRELYQSAADWAEHQARVPHDLRFPQESSRNNETVFPVVSIVPPAPRRRISALATAAVLAVIATAIGIPQILRSDQARQDSVELATGITNTSPAKPVTPSPTLPPQTPTGTPSSQVTTPPAPLPDEVEATIFLLAKTPNGCGRLTPVQRLVPRETPVLGAVHRLAKDPWRTEIRAGISAPLNGLELSTVRQGDVQLVDLRAIAPNRIPVNCRSQLVDASIRQTVNPLLPPGVRLKITLGGDPAAYQAYLLGR